MVEPEESSNSEERYRLLVESAKDYAIFMVGTDGRVADWNAGAQRVFGYREEEIVGRHFSVIFTPEDVLRGIPERELKQAMSEERGEDERWHVRKDGMRFWASGFLRPVRDEGGNLRGFVKVARDTTERKRVEDSLRLLAEASKLLASPLDYRARLRDLARLVVPNLADWCAVDIVKEDGSLERLAVEHEQPENVELALKLQERYPDDPDATYGVPNALRTGEPEMMSEISEELLDEAARDAEHREILRELDLGSYMVVPIVARGRTLGAISFVSGKSRRRYGARDLTVAETLVRRATLAVDNARLYGEARKEIAERRRVEDELRHSRDELEIILGGVADGITVQDPTGQLIYANEAAARMVGYPSGQALIEAPLQEVMRKFEVTDEKGQPFPLENLPGRRALRREESIEKILRFSVVATGEEHWSVVKATPVFNDDGRIRMAVNIFRDVTERRRAEEELRQSEEEYRAIFQLAGVGKSQADPVTGRLLRVNPKFCEITGYTEEELLSMSFGELTHPEDREEDLERFRRMIRQETPEYSAEKRYVRKDGRILWVSVNATVSRDADGRPLRTVATIQNITERKRAEASLRESEERFRSAFEHAPIGMALVGLEDGRWLKVNRLLCDILGYPEEELLGMTFRELTHPDDLDEDLEQVQRLLTREVPSYQMEKRYVRKDGRVVWGLLSASVVRDASGEPLYGIAQVEDITGRKAAEEKLRASEAELRALFEAMTDLIFVVDGEGRYLKIAPTNSSLLYKPPTEMLGKTLHEVFPKEQADEFLSHIRHAFETRRRLTFEYDLQISGQQMWFEATVSPMLEDSVVIVVRDVTERTRAQQLLEERLVTLSHIAATLALQGPMEDTLDILAESVVRASTAVACSVVLTEEKAEAPHLVGSHGLPEGYAESLQAAYQAGVRSPTMEVFRTRHPALVRDVHRLVLSDPLYSPVHDLIREAKWDPVYIVPLISQGRGLGAINFYYVPGQEPGEDEKAFLKAVADQAAVAVQSARLFAEARGKAALEERQRLARELHDSVSQALYGIALGAETARELVEENPKAAVEPLDYVLSLNEAGIAEMRALIFELRPESLEEEGLVVALEKQAAAVRARHKLEVEADLCDEPEAPPEVKEAVYRITQEALNNVVKHAHADSVRLGMKLASGVITLEIYDYGVGFAADGEFPGHLGLRSMRERATKLGGKLEVDSAPGRGTHVRVRIPILRTDTTTPDK